MRTNDFVQPIVTVDVVLMTLVEGDLLLALAKRDREPFAGDWTLPGGWVHTDEDEDALAAAERILKDKAGIKSPYLEQLFSFAGRHRDPRGWSVSIAYYALVPHELIKDNDPRVTWRAVTDVKSMPFDHLSIVKHAVERVRSKTLYSSLPIMLCGSSFTLTELQSVYEQLLGTTLDKRSFRRRIEEMDAIEPVPGGLARGAAHRPAQRYRRKRRFGGQLAVVDRSVTT